MSQVHRHHRNKIMFRKIITYFLILAVVLPIFTIPLFTGVVFAEEMNADESSGTIEGGGIGDVYVGGSKGEQTDSTKKGSGVVDKTGNDEEFKSPCGPGIAGFFTDFANCITFTLTKVLYGFVMWPAIWITGLVGNIFNASIQFSLTGSSFDAEKNIMIKDGWTMVRDLLNLVFIFILLYAAISTILQYGNMDIKKILPSLIIAALLINFSMLITKMVIDASHIFAWEFYNQIDVTDGGKYMNEKDSIEITGDFVKKNLASVFLAGFNPQQILIGNSASTTGNQVSPFNQVVKKATSDGKEFLDVLPQIVIIILSEAVLAIFASFILLAGAILFILRVVVLWLVMIFSPLAFLGMILPSMQKYSGMWWEYLIGQSFFAPAFLFMFMLATKFINSKMIDSLLSFTKNDSALISSGLSMTNIAPVFFNFFIIGLLMMACLIVARQLGGKTAEFGIKWAHKGKDLALSGAKNLAWSPTRYGLRLGGGAAGDSNWWAKSIGRITGGNMLGRKLGAMKKADEDKARKAAEKYAGTLSKAGVASLKRDTEETKGVGGFAKRFIYTGPEGAFKPGKEGYEKVIAKKDEEKKEKELYHESWAYLLGDLKHGEDYSSEEGKKNKENKIKDIEGRIRRGELGLMEEEVEKLQKARTAANEKAKEDNALEIKKSEREIRVLEAQQAELYKEGKHSAMKEEKINELDKAIAKLNKTNAEMTVTEKLFERHEKRTESYRSRQELKGKPAEEKKPEKKKD